MSKKEKKVKEKKEKVTTPEKEAQKSLIVRCVAALLCAVIVCISLNAAFGKIADAVKESESIVPVAGVVSGNNVSTDAPSTDTPADVPSDIPTDDPLTDVPADAPSDTPADTPSDAPSTDTPADKPVDTAPKAPQGKEAIVAYFNNAANNAKKNAKSITKVKEENYQAGGINLGALGMFEGVVNGLIESNMGVNEEQSGRVATTAKDKNAVYHVENESWASKLTAADVKTATCTEKNGVYTITLTVADDDLAESYSHGTGHHGKAFSIVMPQTIKDNAGGAASLLKGLKVGYANGKIVATVDAKTGNITAATYDYVWKLHVDVFGGITAPFGLKTQYKFAW